MNMNILSISNTIFQEKYNISFPKTFEIDEFCKDDILGFIKINYRKLYLIKCKTCENDAELHGYGIYLLRKEQYQKGQQACGCANKTTWTKYQYLVRLTRKSTDSLKFVDFENYNGIKSIGIFECYKHGKMNICIDNFFNSKKMWVML